MAGDALDNAPALITAFCDSRAYQDDTFALDRPLRLTWKHLYRQFGADPARAAIGAPWTTSVRTASAS